MNVKTIVTLLMTLVLAGGLMAQPGKGKGKGSNDKPPKNQPAKGKPSPTEMAARQASNMQKQLELTDEQKSDIEKAAFSRITKMQAIQEKYKAAGSANTERGKDMRMVRQEFVDAVNKVLTPTQQQKWKKLREEKRNQMKANQGKGKGKGKGKGAGGAGSTGDSVPASEQDPNADVDEI